MTRQVDAGSDFNKTWSESVPAVGSELGHCSQYTEYRECFIIYDCACLITYAANTCVKDDDSEDYSYEGEELIETDTVCNR